MAGAWPPAAALVDVQPGADESFSLFDQGGCVAEVKRVHVLETGCGQHPYLMVGDGDRVHRGVVQQLAQRAQCLYRFKTRRTVSDLRFDPVRCYGQDRGLCLFVFSI
jgi:hypothetical protein